MDGGATFSSSLTLLPAGGNVAATVITARISDTAVAGIISSIINLTSTGATSQSLEVRGSVPTITFNPTSLDLGFTTAGVAGTSKTYVLSARFLLASLTVEAPLFVEFSVDGGTTFQTTLSLTPVNNTIPDTAITVRTAASNPVNFTIISSSVRHYSTLGDGLGFVESDLPVSGVINVSPALASPPTASPNPAVSRESVTFTAAAPNGATVSWDFGDGSTAVGSGVSHAYAASGNYTAIATARSGASTVTGSVNVSVSDSVGAAFSGTGSIKFNFSTHQDFMTLSGNIQLSQGFSPVGKSVVVSLGGYRHTFTLNSKGKSGDKTNQLNLAGRIKNGKFTSSTSRLVMVLANQDLFDSLSQFGFENTDISGVKVQPVAIRIGFRTDSQAGVLPNDAVYSAKFLYSAKQGKWGVAKLVP